jgi:hypothetical protein
MQGPMLRLIVLAALLAAIRATLAARHPCT